LIFGPFKLILRIISAIITSIFLYFGITFLQIWMTGQDHSTVDTQAILVFGTTEVNGIPSQELTTRLDEALVLYQEHRAPWIVVTGGNRPGDVYTEGGVSKSFLEQHGVPSSRILVGSGSDTWQNVATVLPQLEAHGIKTVLCVTDPFHEDRAMAIASSQGLQPYPAPVSHSPTSKDGLWKYYAKETLEVGVGRVIGFHLLSEWTTVSTAVSTKVP
jgi:uncharacterized SAM-binding protein YcdF (DUF218 family)